MKRPKKIGIIGTRKRDGVSDFKSCVKRFFEIYEHGDEIVSGGCPKGADRFAEIIAKEYGIPIKIYYPEWKRYGKLAGLKRNELIAQESDTIIAMVARNREGGTEDTIKKAEKLNDEIIIVNN